MRSRACPCWLQRHRSSTHATLQPTKQRRYQVDCLPSSRARRLCCGTLLPAALCTPPAVTPPATYSAECQRGRAHAELIRHPTAARLQPSLYAQLSAR
jgi:hypothetical protein